MSDIERIATNPRRGRVVIHNGLAFLGGQAADDRSGDIRSQTAQALAKADKALAEAGSDRTRILSAQIWLKDIARDFAGMNEVWDGWMSPEHAPARATAQCEMAAPNVLVEITMVAAVAT
ncbi:translation initiation inhibitor, yjgF family [Phenylobacterium zucineum HLK1]|uniref:Translation initiation inhibitor, yjgF family n=1 Tax=Phenylobacterium zucineum (strain HLK1) TaxID=450851 RepID=B4RFW9_PHEZH|nr:RidA family protein [Phenylobacterium zucineum]ACG78782.1 translation initiation inhibitor, yjgF family [Phenylobacterium zucineum HLK1]